MQKIIENALLIVSAALLIWMAASWADVLLHNDPWSGDFQYAAWNIFKILEEMR